MHRPGDVQALVDNNNTFAFDLYQSLQTQDGNLIYSPYSISLALAMTYAGARGATESQMAQTLHFLAQDQLHPSFNALDLQLAERGKAASDEETPLQLDIANAVWAEQTYPFLQSFLDTIALNYGAGIRLADFINQYEAVRKEINSWVSDQTQDKIKDLIPEGVLEFRYSHGAGQCHLFQSGLAPPVRRRLDAGCSFPSARWFGSHCADDEPGYVRSLCQRRGMAGN